MQNFHKKEYIQIVDYIIVSCIMYIYNDFEVLKKIVSMMYASFKNKRRHYLYICLYIAFIAKVIEI